MFDQFPFSEKVQFVGGKESKAGACTFFTLDSLTRSILKNKNCDTPKIPLQKNEIILWINISRTSKNHRSMTKCFTVPDLRYPR